eukprot:gene27907-34483_t
MEVLELCERRVDAAKACDRHVDDGEHDLTTVTIQPIWLHATDCDRRMTPYYPTDRDRWPEVTLARAGAISRYGSSVFTNACRTIQQLLQQRPPRQNVLWLKLLRQQLVQQRLARQRLMRQQVVRQQSVRLKLNLKRQQLLRQQLLRQQVVKRQLVRLKLLQQKLVRPKLLLWLKLARWKLLQQHLMRKDLMQLKLARQQLVKQQLMRQQLLRQQLVQLWLVRQQSVRQQLVRHQLAPQKGNTRVSRAAKKQRREKPIQVIKRHQLVRQQLVRQRLVRQRLVQQKLVRQIPVQQQLFESESVLSFHPLRTMVKSRCDCMNQFSLSFELFAPLYIKAIGIAPVISDPASLAFAFSVDMWNDIAVGHVFRYAPAVIYTARHAYADTSLSSYMMRSICRRTALLACVSVLL